jgi:hypothetical protein
MLTLRWQLARDLIVDKQLYRAGLAALCIDKIPQGIQMLLIGQATGYRVHFDSQSLVGTILQIHELGLPIRGFAFRVVNYWAVAAASEKNANSYPGKMAAWRPDLHTAGRISASRLMARTESLSRTGSFKLASSSSPK